MTQTFLKIVLLGTFVALVGGFLLIMPNAQPLPSGIADSIHIIFSSLRTFNFILPIDILFLLIGITFIAEAALFAIKMVLQITGLAAKLVQGS